jgi:hypothetical protein
MFQMEVSVYMQVITAPINDLLQKNISVAF